MSAGSWQRSEIWIPAVLAVALSAAAFGMREWMLLAIPLVLFAGVALFFKPDLLFFLLGFLTPLSINPHDAEWGSLSLSLPTEPMAAMLVLLFALMVMTKGEVDKRMLSHPISILIYAYFFWLGVTTLTSVDKLVSLKFVIAKIWFIVPGYFLAGAYFRNPENIFRYLSLFVGGMLVVSCHNIVHLAQYGFEDKPSQYTMQPFFKDHTILGAVSAMTLPVCLGLFRQSRADVVKRGFFFMAILIITTGTLITYSRAAWASLAPALLLLLAYLLHIRFRWLLMFFLLILAFLIANLEGILMEMERNKIAGSDDLMENAESITNISSDPSNLERINRWASAIEMWKDRPVFGFGPGTYMFEYAPYQLGRNYTSISTNFGDIGNAHSEYLGPLAETGLRVWSCSCFFFLLTMFYAFRGFHASNDRASRILISTLACALVTYFSHGFLNNFLDTDKASFLFWPMISAVVVMDIRLRRQVEQGNEENRRHAGDEAA
jgi:putative inorganic carbon (HCO3(-)) transporter